MAPLKHALLVSTALLRLLRAEVVRVRSEHTAIESRMRRVNSRADNASTEIALLEDDVSWLQARDSASSNVIRSLRQQVAALEERLTDSEEKLAEKDDELLTTRHSSRSLPSTCTGTSWCRSSSRSCPESDDDSDADSASDMSRLAEAESLLRAERAVREASEQRFALAQTQLAECTTAADFLRQEIDETRHENAGLEERALILEEDCSQAMVCAADAEDAQLAAEASAASARAEVAVALAWAAGAAAQIESLRCRIIETDDRHACDVKRLHSEQNDTENAYREQAEQHRKEIICLHERLAEVEFERRHSREILDSAAIVPMSTRTLSACAPVHSSPLFGA